MVELSNAMQVLLADDDRVALGVLRNALSRDHVVKIVSTGEAAIEAFGARSFDLVVLDWRLPGLGGVELVRALRRREDEPRAVFLLATAFDDAGMISEALEAGVDDYVLKPLGLTALRARLAVAVERFHLRAATRHRKERMRQAIDRSEAIARSRAEFLANMTHELRTPVRDIVAATESLLVSALDTEQQRQAEQIRLSARRLNNTVSDVLDLSGVDSQRLRVDPVPMNLGSTVEETVELFRSRAESRGLSLDVERSPELPSALIGDPRRLRQVLTHLLNNALLYTKQGGVRVQAQLVERVEGSVRVRISVLDTGVGIPAADQGGLFGSASQDLTRGRSHGGRGFGLPVCREIVSLMDGDLGVHSEPGQGSVFWMELLMALPDDALAAMHEAPRANRSGLHALVVEDNAVNRRVICWQLERLGCRVSSAASGRQAVEDLTRLQPDVVLMDVEMPEMGGLEATRRMRSMGLTVPVIGLSASTQERAAERCMKVGMDYFLRKPPRIEQMQEALQEVAPGSADLITPVESEARAPALSSSAL